MSDRPGLSIFDDDNSDDRDDATQVMPAVTAAAPQAPSGAATTPPSTRTLVDRPSGRSATGPIVVQAASPPLPSIGSPSAIVAARSIRATPLNGPPAPP